MLTKIKASWRKTYPDVRAVVTKQYPDFVYGANRVSSERQSIPVFYFHAVEPESFERYLTYLKENGYCAIDSAECLDELRHPSAGSSKKVLLSFDDGHISLYRTAFPLLRKFDFRAVSFICPGLIPSGESGQSVEEGRRLCTWSEIQEMHGADIIDFQCHSFTHDLVFTSDEIVDFLGPAFKSPFFGRTDQAMLVNDGVDISLTNLRAYDSQLSSSDWGIPVYRHKPRMAAKQRFKSSGELRERLKDFVIAHGGRDFFRLDDWKKTLRNEIDRVGAKAQGQLIKGEDYQNQIASECERAKSTIEAMLPGKKVDYLCPPWFVATEDALRTAETVGFRAAFLGVERHIVKNSADNKQIRRVQRLPYKYINRLPGKNRSRLLSTFLDRSG